MKIDDRVSLVTESKILVYHLNRMEPKGSELRLERNRLSLLPSELLRIILLESDVVHLLKLRREGGISLISDLYQDAFWKEYCLGRGWGIQTYSRIYACEMLALIQAVREKLLVSGSFSLLAIKKLLRELGATMPTMCFEQLVTELYTPFSRAKKQYLPVSWDIECYRDTDSVMFSRLPTLTSDDMPSIVVINQFATESSSSQSDVDLQASRAFLSHMRRQGERRHYHEKDRKAMRRR